jgi:hypothetical protein
MKQARYISGFAALLIGCTVIHFGDRLLGVKIELFYGLQTFNFLWMLDMFVLPFLDGVLVAIIFGLGGKWLCYFPPLIVRLISYEVLKYGVVPQGTSLMPMGWWGFFVILTIEAAAFGGIIGEVVMKGTYGRSAPEKIYKGRTSVEEDDS